MSKTYSVFRALVLFASICVLSACGGGGSTENTSAPPPTVSSTSDNKNESPKVEILGESEALEQTEFKLLAIASDDKAVVDYNWVYESNGHTLNVSGQDKAELIASSGDIDHDIEVIFTVTVTDEEGLRSSSEHQVILKAQDIIAPLIEIKGPEKLVEQSEAVFLANIEGIELEQSDLAWSYQPEEIFERFEANGKELVVVSRNILQTEVAQLKLFVTDSLGEQHQATHQITLVPASPQISGVNISGPDSALAETTFELTSDVVHSGGTPVTYLWHHDSNLTLTLAGVDTDTLHVTVPKVRQETNVNFTLVVSDDKGASQSSVHKVTLKPAPLFAPSVSITGNSSVFANSELILNAQGSDKDGHIVSYRWHYVSDVELSLGDAVSDTLTVSVPDVDEDTQATFAVTVVDDSGLEATASHSVIIVAPENSAPIVSITGSTSLQEGDKEVLTAVATDQDGTIAKYHWHYPSDAPIQVSGENSAQLTVETTDISSTTQVNLDVIVTDNEGATAQAQVLLSLTPLPNQKPVVQITSEQTTFVEKQAFTLQGEAQDTDGHITSYQWQHNGPNELQLSGVNSAVLSVHSHDIQEELPVTFTLNVTDNLGEVSQATFEATIEAIKHQLTLAGTITDEPIGHANVEVQIGADKFLTQANSVGEYTIDVNIDESQVNAMTTIRATGINSQSHVELISLLGEVDELTASAGDDGVLNSEEVFGVNVTNLTTIEYGLIQDAGVEVSEQASLNAARKNIDPDEKLSLAAVVKAVIDHGHALPEGINSTLDLAKDLPKARKMLRQLKSSNPDLFKQIRQDIKKDEQLMQHAAFVPNGTYVLSELSHFNGFTAKLIFNNDNTGRLEGTAIRAFTWSQTGANLILNLAQPLDIYETGSYFRPDYQVDQISMALFHSSGGTFSAEVSMRTVAKTGEPAIEASPFHGYFASVSSLPSYSESDFLGKWHINMQQTTRIAYAQGIEFLANNIAHVTSVKSPSRVYWSVSNNQLYYSFGQYSYKISVIREFELGLQVLVEQDSFITGKQIFPALLVKSQNISFNDINYVKTWSPEKLKGETESFLIDKNNYFQYAWQRNVFARMQDGKLLRHNYSFAGKNSEKCDTNLEQCTADHNFEFTLLAKKDDLIAVQYSSVDLRGESPNFIASQVFIFRLSDEGLDTSFFTDSFVSNNNNYFVFGSRPSLYQASAEGITHLQGQRHCHRTESNTTTCNDAIYIGNNNYWVSREGDLLLLVDIDTNEQSYLKLISSDENGVTLCHFTQNAVCTEQNITYFSFAKPALDINITQEGIGQVISSVNAFTYKESFKLLLQPDDDYTVSEVSGCEGTLEELDDQSFIYSVIAPLADCDIHIKFGLKPPFFGEQLFVNSALEIPHSWYFQFNIDGTGVANVNSNLINFTIEQTDTSEYQAEFAQMRYGGSNHYSVRVGDGQYITATGFKLNYRDDGVYLIWLGVKGQYDTPYETSPVLLTNSKDIQTINVSSADIVGNWTLSYGLYRETSSSNTSQNIEITLNEDQTGVLSTGHNKGFPREDALSWELTSDKKLRLFQERYGNVAELRLIHSSELGYQFLVEYIKDSASNGYSSGWLQHGSGILIKHRDYTFEDISGKWRFKDGSIEKGFELHSDGTYTEVNINGAASAEWKSNTLYVSGKYNDKFDIFDPFCDLQNELCIEGYTAQYKVLGQDGSDLYVLDRRWWPIGNYEESKLLKVALNSDPALSQFEPHMLGIGNLNYHWQRRKDHLKLYEIDSSTTRYWRIDTDSNGLQLAIEDKFTAPISFEAGKLKYLIDDVIYWVEIVNSNQNGIWVCRYAQGESCNESNQHFLSYEIPSFEVKISAGAGGQVKTNLIGDYQLYNLPLEIEVEPESGMYVMQFDACHLRHSLDYRWYRNKLVFDNDELNQVCHLNIEFKVWEKVQSERLGITDPSMAACVNQYNRASNPHIEYEDELKCDNGSNMWESLAELDKFEYLTQLTLSNVSSFSEQSQAQLQSLTNLKKLSLNSVNLNELDLSQLTDLRAFELSSNNRLNMLTLPEGSPLMNLKITAGGPRVLNAINSDDLQAIVLSGSDVEILDVTGSNNVYSISAGNSQLQQIVGVTKQHELSYLSLDSTPVVQLDLSNYVNLEILRINKTQITELDITGMHSLESLHASESALQNLSINDESNLRRLDAWKTQLTWLELSRMPNLDILNIQDSKLTSLDLTGALNLSNLYANNNQIKSVVMPIESQLTSLTLQNNQISDLEFVGEGKNDRLVYINLENNLINHFSDEKLGRLRNLTLSGNPLSSLELGNKSIFWRLYLNDTKLTSFDTTGFVKLEELYLNNTQITQIDIPASISKLSLNNTGITTLNLPNGLRHSTIYFGGNTLGTLQGGSDLYAIRLYLTDTQRSEQVEQYLQENSSVIRAYECNEIGGFSCRSIN